MSFRIPCAEIWGGIENTDQEIETGAVKASIYSRSASGGKGGDIYYFSVCGGDQLTRIAVADVMGHGENVSQMSHWVYSELKENIGNPHGASLMAHLNNVVENKGLKAMTTLALVSLIVKNSHIAFTYAGHPPMMILRTGQASWQPAHVANEQDGVNMPLGVIPDAPYQEHEEILNPGDRLFIYTDGLLEAPSPTDELFGQERLLQVLNQNLNASPSELKQKVLHAVEQHTSGPIDHDDVTLLAIETFPIGTETSVF